MGTVLNAGAAQSLSVTFTPTDSANYATAGATTTIDVSKAPATIAWAAPAPIVYGTALSSTQLDATASTPGSFTYSPAAGTILDAGSHTLSATFTPSDTADFQGGSASVTIDVAKAEQTIQWSNPADIVYGTPLSSTQLNATVNGPGAPLRSCSLSISGAITVANPSALACTHPGRSTTSTGAGASWRTWVWRRRLSTRGSPSSPHPCGARILYPSL